MDSVTEATMILFRVTRDQFMKSGDTPLVPWGVCPDALACAVRDVFNAYIYKYVPEIRTDAYRDFWAHRDALVKSSQQVQDIDQLSKIPIIDWVSVQSDPEVSVVSFVGPIASGKSTSGDYVRDKYAYTCVAFAESLKQFVMYVFNLSWDQVNDQQCKATIDLRWKTTPRRLLQVVGTQLMRTHLSEFVTLSVDYITSGGSIWVYLMQYAGPLPIRRVCITDLRFMNEYAFVAQFQKHAIVRLVRFRGPNANPHISETELESIPANYVIQNTSSMDNLYTSIDKIMASHTDSQI